MECEFCKRLLNSLSSLNYHKKNNKKCLQMQNTDTELLNCEFCEKLFCEKSMKVHLKSCKNKRTNDDNSKDNIIYEQNETIKVQNDIIRKQNDSITDKDIVIEEQNISIDDLKNIILSLQM